MPEQSERLNTALVDRYRVAQEVGAGGMATVYVARDVKHDRDVAIKVLHPDLGAALGGERFLAEIKTTAKLQHPNILPLLDSGAADGLLFYVMPLVEGETLRARLARERQLPIDAALRIATEVAGALDYAHRHGVIHRDIKPENILLHDGRAVVADFGIALAVSAASGSRMTQTGLSLGTPQYMSPEQATGEKHIDARADVYALGAVLYEMLTGEPPFSGATVQAIVAKVLTERPMQPSAVRDTIPPHVEVAVLKSLAKLPADRHASAAEFASALERPEATAGFPVHAGRRRSSIAREMFGEASLPGRLIPWTIAAVALGVGAWAAVTSRAAPEAPSAEVRAELAPVRDAVPAILGAGQPVGLSDDGAQLAFVGVDASRIPSLFVRSLANDAQWAVPASNFANSPVFSPDGESVAFAQQGIKVIRVGAAAARTVLPSSAGFAGMTWLNDSSLVIALTGGLLRVSLDGDEPTLLIAPPDSLTRFVNPAPTADGRAILVQVVRSGASRVGVLRIGASTVDDLGILGARPRLVRGNLIVYWADGSLRSVPVDRKTLRPVGDPALVGDNAFVDMRVTPAVSANGLVVFVAGGSFGEGELVLADRAGNVRTLVPQRQAYRYPRFSPDGRRLAYGVSNPGPGSGDVWTLAIVGATTLRVTADTTNYHPEWTPDGRALLYIHRGGGALTVQRVPADGSGPAATLIEPKRSLWEMVMTPDGRALVFRADQAGTGRDIFVAHLDSVPRVDTLLGTRFDEKGIALSPDGRWLAYSSDEGGPSDVYIRRLDPSSPRWRVSQGGGVEPRWAKTGELFFRRGDSVLVTRPTLGAQPVIGEPRFVLRGDYAMSMFEPLWDVSPDARQFVFVRHPDSGRLKIVVLVNWIDRVRGAK